MAKYMKSTRKDMTEGTVSVLDDEAMAKGTKAHASDISATETISKIIKGMLPLWSR
jgi:hypothetical protein